MVRLLPGLCLWFRLLLCWTATLNHNSLQQPGHATRQRQIERAHARTKLQHDTGNNRRGTDSMQAGGWINARFKTDVAGLGSNGRRSVGFNPAALEV